MASMLALCKESRSVALVRFPVPALAAPHDVRIRVTVAGLCRTDSLVAEGRLPCRDGVVLGHEFVGTVDAIGPAVTAVRCGDHVVVNPIIACGSCGVCVTSDAINCPYRTMLGVEHDGAFAEFTVVSETQVHVVGTRLRSERGAYVEPLAAALAVLRVPQVLHGPGLILGRNRFATLLERAFHQAGITEVATYDPTSDAPRTCDTFAWAVETHLTAAHIAEMIRLVRPGGTVIVKSRTPDDVAMNWLPAVTKRLHLVGANYGSFEQAIRLLSFNQIAVDDLIGQTYPLSEWPKAFTEAQRAGAAKIFLRPE